MGGGRRLTRDDCRAIRRLFLVGLIAFLALGAAGLSAGLAPPVVADLDEIEGDADRVHLEIHLTEDGDAEWQVQYRIDLPTDDERTAFDELESDIEDDPNAYTSSYRERMEAAAETGTNTTAREMSIENVTIETDTVEVPEPAGVVLYEFTWKNFAASDDGSLHVGDTIHGMFLDNETSLAVHWPEGWDAVDVTPSPTDERSDAVVWRGPFEFSAEEPQLTVSPETEGVWAQLSPVAILSGFVLLVALAIAGWMGIRRYHNTGAQRGPEPDTIFDEVDQELLSNEEQVMQVLRAHGGRMKQKELAEELDWTAAKTSQVTTAMRDSERIEGFRLGRENVLKLPDTADTPTE